MDIDEIKNRLKNKKVLFQPNVEAPSSKVVKEVASGYDEPKRIYVEEPTATKRREPPSSHQELFTRVEDEPQEPPESKVWSCREQISIEGMTPEEFVDMLGLCDDVYDWKRTSRKGRKSRDNFRKLILEIS